MIHMLKKERLKDLNDRLQFAFVLTLFFPTMLSAFFGTNHQVELNQNIALYGLVILCLILTYVYIAILAERMQNWLISTCNFLLLLQIAFFVPIYYVMAVVQKGEISHLFILPFGISIFGIILIPIGIFTLLGTVAVLQQWRWLPTALKTSFGRMKV